MLEMIDISDLEAACRASPEEKKEMIRKNDLGFLIVPLAKYANMFDDYTESMVDEVMCSDTCPCYQSDTDHNITQDGMYYLRTDAYHRYQTLGIEYLKTYNRVFFPKDAYDEDQ